MTRLQEAMVPDKTHPSWVIATEVGEGLAKDRKEAEKEAVHVPAYGKERLEPMEFAKRYMEAGPELREKMLTGLRAPKDGMKRVRRFVEALNKTAGQMPNQPRPPQLRIPQ